MRVISLPPQDLRPNPWNSNVVSQENEEKLDASIKRFGMFKPVVCRYLSITDTFEILGGEHRVKAAIRLKMPTIPVIDLGEIDDQKAKEIGLVDNGRYGADDALQLAEILDSLGKSDELTSFLPWSSEEMAAISASVDVALDSLDLDADEDERPKPTTKAPKTHTIMRFKVPIGDAESISKLIESVMKEQGFNDADSLQNAGDALVHITNRFSDAR